jgi:hypothetical protein
MNRIVSIVGNTINLAAPIPLDFSPSLNIRAYPMNSPAHTTLCGIEDMTLDAQNTVDTPIYFYGADRCWVKGVELKNVPGSDIGMIRYHGCFQCEINTCYIHDTMGWPGQTDGFATSFNYGTSNCLIVNTIVRHVADLCETNGASGNAYLYNYAIDMNRASSYARGITLSHGPHGFMNLAEGNVLPNFCNDGYHGSTSHIVMFRNHVNGQNMAQRKIINICRGSYYHTVVGNILGDTSWNPTYYEQPLNPSTISAVYVLGFPTADTTGLSGYTEVPWVNWTKPTNVPDADVVGTLLRHGNYDYYNKAVVWDSNISSHTIPDSLIYTSKPSFFGTLQWPPIGPDVAGRVSPIPAQARWNAYLSSGRVSDLF